MRVVVRRGSGVFSDCPKSNDRSRSAFDLSISPLSHTTRIAAHDPMWIEDAVKFISKEVFFVDPRRAPPSQRNAVVGAFDVQPGHATSSRAFAQNPFETRVGAANAGDRLARPFGAWPSERAGVGGRATASRVLANRFHPYATVERRTTGNVFKTPAPRARLAFGEAHDGDDDRAIGENADPLQSSFLGGNRGTLTNRFPVQPSAWRGTDGVGARHRDASGSRGAPESPAPNAFHRRRSLFAPAPYNSGCMTRNDDHGAGNGDMTFEESARKSARAMARGIFEDTNGTGADQNDAEPAPPTQSHYQHGPRPFDPTSFASPGAPTSETLLIARGRENFELQRQRQLVETTRLTSAMADATVVAASQMSRLQEKAGFKPGYAVAAAKAAKERGGGVGVNTPPGNRQELRLRTANQTPQSVADILSDETQLREYRARVAASKNSLTAPSPFGNETPDANDATPEGATLGSLNSVEPPHQATGLSPLQTRGVIVEAAAARAARASDPVFAAREDEVARMIEEMALKADALEKRRPSALVAETDDVSETDETAEIEAALTAPLNPDTETLVTSALGRGPGSEQIASGFFAWQGELSVTRKDVATMAPGVWLNDEMVNFTIGTMALRETQRVKGDGNDGPSTSTSTSQPRFHLMSTFFVKKLCDGGSYDYNAVRRWTTVKKLGYDMLGCDTIIIPVHQGIHWVLATVELREKRVRLYDSLHGEDHHLLNCLRRWVADEHENKKNESVDTSGWRLEHPKDIPRQMNGCDCGVFMLKYADYIASGVPLSFSQQDMKYFRRRIVADALAAHGADSRGA